MIKSTYIKKSISVTPERTILYSSGYVGIWPHTTYPEFWATNK